jgi:hypothetical protein
MLSRGDPEKGILTGDVKVRKGFGWYKTVRDFNE